MDGMDAGVVSGGAAPSSSSLLGPADAEEDEINSGGEDAETTCSICLIN